MCILSFTVTYVGNILAAGSLFGNDINYSLLGVPPICQSGVDRYIPLYFGLSLNMIILVLNTKYRYDGISSIRNRTIPNTIHTRDVVCKVWLPAFLSAVLFTCVAVAIQVFVIDYQFLISISICVLPIAVSAAWNVLLSRTIKRGRKTVRLLQRKESMVVLKRATFIIHVTIGVYVASLLVSVVAVVCSLFYLDRWAVVSLSWLLRAFSLLLFTVEGHVYLSKVSVARQVVKRKFLQCFSRSKNNGGPGVWARAGDDEEITLNTATDDK